ncbi:hypothetical protein EV144_1011492 [Flavobacterium sp. 270]|uniref:hypothetical protein n=1 Tax=Flavobacterium sp. 270 TaxID=2512114 RepID=UPI0010662FD5|nr:hypothetical protein [Flavobacterium sp. 270]TDW52799.1 hypothetical protein EV144_1011492 [Flavobacterium sp. 270]
MKKRILLAAVLQIFMVLGSCSSDSGNNDAEKPVELKKGEIKADFDSFYGADDFVIDKDDNVFFIGQTPNDKDYIWKFQKIDKDGKLTLLKGINNDIPFSGRMAVSNAGEFLLIGDGLKSETDKIFRFENNFTELNPFYTMKPISSPLADKIRLIAITGNNDNTYFVSDYNAKNIKRVLPESGGDVFVAGSGKNAIVDGTGLNASFGGVSKLVSNNNIIYLIDNLYSGTTFVSSNIRKLEYVNNQWKVTTLSSTTNTDNFYNNIAFDSKNDMYVSVSGKGIYKFNLADNTLSLFADAQLKIFTGTTKLSYHSEIDLKFIYSFKFKNNDLYLLTSNSIIKISDYQAKLDAATK